METEEIVEIKYTSYFELLKHRSFKPSKRKSDRHILFDEINTTLGIPKIYSRGIYFQCKNLTEPEIREAFDSARKWKTNPSALFRKLIKEKSNEIKQRLSLS